jgi:hypothetical protein
MSSNYNIRLLNKSELKLLQAFIKENLSDNHILARTDLLIKWQHETSSGFNFIIGDNLSQNRFYSSCLEAF